MTPAAGPPELVWYCAYGSNLDGARFARYLTGCRDGAPPRADRPRLLAGRLRFERSSPSWDGGGVAFLDLVASGPALGRCWLVTREQLEDVVAQENRIAAGAVAIDWEALAAGAHHDVGSGWYARVVACGAEDGVAVVTFTAPEHGPPTAPSRRYLEVIVRGLRSAHRLDPAAVADYLLAAPGVAPTWSRDALMAL